MSGMPEPECLRIVAEQLAYLDWSGKKLHKMLAVSPRAFLGGAVPTSAPEES
jgi:hypothetical protein